MTHTAFGASQKNGQNSSGTKDEKKDLRYRKRGRGNPSGRKGNDSNRFQAMISGRRFLFREISISYWLPVLIMVVAFLLYPVRLFVSMNAVNFYVEEGQNYTQALHALRMDTLLSALGSRDVLTIVSIPIAAILCACTVFYYLDSRERTDFYHTLAFTRSRLYRLQFAAGWVCAAVPWLINVWVAYFAVGGVYGLLTAAGLKTVCRAVLLYLLAFTAVYGICVLAMVLTGRLLTGILVSLFFLGYGPVCFEVIRSLILERFETYSSLTDFGGWIGWLLSPLSVMILPQKWLKSILGMPAPGFAGSSLLAALVLAAYIILAFLAGMFLYKRRPSEAAECALTNQTFGLVIKIMVSIPAGVLLGYVFSRYTDARNVSWMFFSLIGAFLVNAAIEFIYSRDLKNAVSHWISLLVTMGGTAAFIGVLLLNPFGYDTWLPRQEEIISMAMLTNNDGINEVGKYSYETENISSVLKNSETHNFQPIYALAEAGIRHLSDEDTDSFEPGVSVLFRMKDGSVRYRQYRLPEKTIQKAMRELSKDAAWRKQAYPANYLRASAVQEVKVVPWKVEDGPGTTPELSGKEIHELLRCLSWDMDAMDVSAMEKETPLGSLEFTPEDWNMGITDPDSQISIQSLYIYPEYTKTLDFLRDHEIVLDEEKKSVPTLSGETTGTGGENRKSEILSIQIDNEEGTYVVSDPEKIAEILKGVHQIRGNQMYAESGYCYLMITYAGTQDTRDENIRLGRETKNILKDFRISN